MQTCIGIDQRKQTPINDKKTTPKLFSTKIGRASCRERV